MSDPGCPTDDELLALCSGRLDHAAAAALDAHVGACASCRTIVQHLGREAAPPTRIPPPTARRTPVRRAGR